MTRSNPQAKRERGGKPVKEHGWFKSAIINAYACLFCGFIRNRKNRNGACRGLKNWTFELTPYTRQFLKVKAAAEKRSLRGKPQLFKASRLQPKGRSGK